MIRLAPLALVLALLVPAGPAGAYSIQGRPWPGGTILYTNAAPDQSWALQQAVDAWNASGAAIRFVPASPAQAQLVVRYFPQAGNCGGPGVAGEATVGYVSRATVYIGRVDPASQRCNAYTSARTLAHELGHVLGLGHESRGCATMNPNETYLGPEFCQAPYRWEWNCALLQADDVAGAVALYGGLARTPTTRYCDLYAAIGTPSGLRVQGAGAAGVVKATFVRPADPQPPAFLLPLGRIASFKAQIARGACARRPDLSRTTRWDAAPRGVESTYFGSLTPGRYCVSVWAVDALGRASAAPATAWIEMT